MPSENTDVIFECVAKNICSTRHSKKRQLKGNRCTIAADAMIKQRKEAIIYRREEAKRLKDFGDKSPPILPSSIVLRKVKEERLLNQHGLIFSNHVLNLLNHAKYGKYALILGSCLFIACTGLLNNNSYTQHDVKRIEKRS